MYVSRQQCSEYLLGFCRRTCCSCQIDDYALYCNIKMKTIFEAGWEVIPNSDLVPPVGCFCARLMDNSVGEDWKLDPKNQSGVFLGFAHRRNIYGAQNLVDKSIITAKHQIAYHIELFPFQQRDNSNDRLQFLHWLLKRKTASIFDTALDNDHLNSATTER